MTRGQEHKDRTGSREIKEESSIRKGWQTRTVERPQAKLLAGYDGGWRLHGEKDEGQRNLEK